MLMNKNGNIISFLNMKGGVAKTTLCINIGHTLSTLGKKVLIIDMDPQFNATQSLIEKFKNEEFYLNLVEQGNTVVKIFNQSKKGLVKRSSEVNKEDIIIKLSENLHLVCGDLDLIVHESSDRGIEKSIKRFIEKNMLRNEYDFIFIDCPPTYSFYTTASIVASDYYLLPVKPDLYSMLGIDLLDQVMEKINDLYEINVKCFGVIFTMIPDKINKSMEKIFQSFESEYGEEKHIFSTHLKYVPSISTISKDKLMLDSKRTSENILEITKEFLERDSKL
jgi:chromosome partitioning protein